MKPSDGESSGHEVIGPLNEKGERISLTLFCGRRSGSDREEPWQTCLLTKSPIFDTRNF